MQQRESGAQSIPALSMGVDGMRKPLTHSHTALVSDPAPACFAPSLGSLPAGVVDEEYERQMGGWGDD